jgi:hypothetical protein
MFVASSLRCGGEEEPNVPEAVYGGKASDEALERVLDKLGAAEVSAAMSAVITSPAGNGTVSSTVSPAIAWNLPSAAEWSPEGVPAEERTASWTWGPGVAWAHLPPVTGHVFLLEFRGQGSQEVLVRLFTTDMSWRVDDTSWGKLKAKGMPIEIKMYNAYLNRNVVEEGPYTPPSTTTFSIAPGS